MLLLYFFLIKGENEINDDDFWDSISDIDAVEIISSNTGNLYEKARFDLPILRRLRLYEGAYRAVTRLDKTSGIEFVYESKVPSLVFLDAQDVAIERIDISKLSQDEIFSVLQQRGFSVDDNYHAESEL